MLFVNDDFSAYTKHSQKPFPIWLFHFRARPLCWQRHIVFTPKTEYFVNHDFHAGNGRVLESNLDDIPSSPAEEDGEEGDEASDVAEESGGHKANGTCANGANKQVVFKRIPAL